MVKELYMKADAMKLNKFKWRYVNYWHHPRVINSWIFPPSDYPMCISDNLLWSYNSFNKIDSYIRNPISGYLISKINTFTTMSKVEQMGRRLLIRIMA